MGSNDRSDAPDAAGSDPRSFALFAGAADGASALIDRLRRLAPRQARHEAPEEIARGGMGAILRVRDRVLRRDLAMKVARDASVERFLDEAAITGQLDHPGIVPVHELGIDADGRLFFTMRLIEGHTFDEVIGWIARGEHGFSLVRALDVLRRACEAVAHAHRHGVLHRDLKPSNVMVGNFGETYVVDWGLARVTGAPESATAAKVRRAGGETGSSYLRTLHGTVLGTPAYMSPEQAAGRIDEITPASDVYSAGAMLYHVLTGHPPYRDVSEATATAESLVAAVRARPPTPIARRARAAPPELVSICEKAMRRAPRERHADMGELAADLRAFLENRVVRAHRTGAWVEFRKWIARNRTASLAATVALIATLGGLGAVAGITTAKNRELADANGEAQARYDDVTRLASLKRVRDLARDVDRLWPATEAELPAIEHWLAQARDVAAERPRHAATLEALASSSALDSEFVAWWRESLGELLQGIDTLLAAEPARIGTIAEMERRRDRAATLRQRSLDDHEEEWRDAVAEARDEPRYRGLALTPQLGLAPLGRDPDSGLLEFWQVDSGDPVVRDSSSGHLQIGESSSIVLVLLPGGKFDFGAQSRRPDLPNFDPTATADAQTVSVELAPFFLSKFEMTQAQWLRLTGSNPSRHSPGSTECAGKHTLLHPVDDVSWREATNALQRLGLLLPTSAQWEYAERAGTSSCFATGATPETLRGAGNVADLSALELQELDRAQLMNWQDGFPCVAPVGRFKPNGFGLHDMIGNLSEACRDLFVGRHADAEFAQGDGEQRPRAGSASSGERVNRGSNFSGGALRDALAAFETSEPEDAREERNGLRPARRLDP